MHQPEEAADEGWEKQSGWRRSRRKRVLLEQGDDEEELEAAPPEAEEAVEGPAVPASGEQEAKMCYEKRQMVWKGMSGSCWTSLVQQWGVRKVEALQLQKSIAAVMREVGPKLGDLHWREATGMGQRSRVLPAEAAGMLEAARHAKRLRDPGWRGDRGQSRWPVQRLLEWAVKELTLSRRGVEMELGGLEDWLEREQMERKMGDSLLKWLGHDKPPSVRVSHKVWRKQLVDRTRQLKLGADRARQQSDMLLLDGTDIVGAAEAVTGHEPVRAEAEPGPAAEEGLSDAEEWGDWEVEDWVAGSGAGPEDAEAETGAGTWAEAGARAEGAAPEGCEAAGRGREEAAAAGLEAPAEVWWEAIRGNTEEGAARAVELDVALQAFAATVEVDGASGDGQLAKQLGNLSGQEGWRLGLVRLVAGDLSPVVSAVCVVSEARPRRGRVFRMMALAVDGKVRGQGLATEALARMKAELLMVAGPRFELRADLASCMKKGGAAFYASQGWSGADGIWSWRSEAAGEEEALRHLASGEALEQRLQECEQDMEATDGAMAEMRGALLGDRRRSGKEQDGQPVRHSLWEQDTLEAYNELLFGSLDAEVEAVQQRRAIYDEERRLSEGSDSCWSGAGSDSDSAAEMGGGEGESAVVEQAGNGKGRHKQAEQPVKHSLWEQESLEALNEVLSGLLEDEVRALRQSRADYDEARRLSEGSDSCWSDSGGDSGSESTPELDIGLPTPQGAGVVGAGVVGVEEVILQHQGRATAVARKRRQREEQTGGTKRRGGQGGAGQAGGKRRRRKQGRAPLKQARREVATGGVQHQPWWHQASGWQLCSGCSGVSGVGARTGRQRDVAWSKAGREQGECYRVDAQWEAAETGGWEQQVVGQAERER